MADKFSQYVIEPDKKPSLNDSCKYFTRLLHSKGNARKQAIKAHKRAVNRAIALAEAQRIELATERDRAALADELVKLKNWQTRALGDYK